jgi:hypothetical protein
VRLHANPYLSALARCFTVGAPWYVVPTKRKWYRGWAVSQILIETMEDMKLTYPNLHVDVRSVQKTLRAVA